MIPFSPNSTARTGALVWGHRTGQVVLEGDTLIAALPLDPEAEIAPGVIESELAFAADVVNTCRRLQDAGLADPGQQSSALVLFLANQALVYGGVGHVGGQGCVFWFP